MTFISTIQKSMAEILVLISILTFYYIIISEIMIRLRNIEQTPYLYALRDAFGVGTAISGAATATANVVSTKLTNDANKEIADKNNETQLLLHEQDRQFNAAEAEKSREFNSAEAEKSREFNSVEAEKTREWNSESAVVQRRKDAGLNTALTGNGGSTSGSSSVASSSPVSSAPASAPSAPVLNTPVMQAPDFSSSIDSGVRLAKATSEIADNKASAKRQLAQTAHEEQLTKQARLLNEMTPQMNNLLLSKQRLDNMEKQVLIEYNSHLLDNAFMQGFQTYCDTILSQEQINLDANMFLTLHEESRHQMEQDALMFEKEWSRKHFESSFRYGNSETKRRGWNIGAEGGVNNDKSKSDFESVTNSTSETFKGKPKSSTNSTSTKFGGILGSVLGVNGQLKGGYQDYTDSQTHLQNQEYYQLGVEYTACLNILKNTNYSAEVQNIAKSRIKNIQITAQSYALFIRQLGKYKSMPSNFNNTVQDFEEQQIGQ